MRNSETAIAAASRIAPGSQSGQRSKRVGHEIGAGFGFVTGEAAVLPHVAGHRQVARLGDHRGRQGAIWRGHEDCRAGERFPRFCQLAALRVAASFAQAWSASTRPSALPLKCVAAPAHRERRGPTSLARCRCGQYVRAPRAGRQAPSSGGQESSRSPSLPPVQLNRSRLP